MADRKNNTRKHDKQQSTNKKQNHSRYNQKTQDIQSKRK